MNQLKKTIALTAAYYGLKVPDEVIAMYAEDLSDLPENEVIYGYNMFRKNPKNTRMPLPAQIRGIIRPDVDADSAAREIASRITHAVAKIGWVRQQEAREFIGDVGWNVVERMGGWIHICENLGRTIDPTAFQAQCRDLAKVGVQYTPEQLDKAISAGTKRGELQSAADILKLVTGKQNKQQP